MQDNSYDILVIGGGINGAMVARDAAGRGLSVLLVEKDDLASGTSSASSKMIHGGLRYLEHYDFSLVRESLREREIMLATAPHIVRPLRLILPRTTESRPAWLIRAGLWIYDHLAGHISLPRSARADLTAGPYAEGLKSGVQQGFAYSDCWSDDARLVVLAARDASGRGARIMTRTRCVKARREGQVWRASLAQSNGTIIEARAKVIINAAGPWAHEVLTSVTGGATKRNLRLVKGSHIVVPRLYAGDHAFLLQNDDGRVIFVIPFEAGTCLIGTTEVVHGGKAGTVAITDDETAYLCAAVNRYFQRPIKPGDVVWSFAGLRPLVDDGQSDPAAITRDYAVEEERPENGAPLISIFGGKLTTARQLAERVVDALNPPFAELKGPWTSSGVLPGGDIEDFEAFTRELVKSHPGFKPGLIEALARRHGSDAGKILGDAKSDAGLGKNFGGKLFAAEVDWLMEREWAESAQDVLWRRTKCGLEVADKDVKALENYMKSRARTRS